MADQHQSNPARFTPVGKGKATGSAKESSFSFPGGREGRGSGTELARAEEIVAAHCDPDGGIHKAALIASIAAALASPPSSVARGAAADVMLWCSDCRVRVPDEHAARNHERQGCIVRTYHLAALAPLPDAPLNTAQIHAWLGRWIDHLPATAVLELQWLAPLPDATPSPLPDLTRHLARQREFSDRTFGPGARTAGVLDHIRKELHEIEAKPLDLSEWIDVVILGFDGAGRAGHSPEAITAALVAKQTKNEGRTWPDWRTAPLNKAIEHVRADPPSSSPAAKEQP